MSTPNAPASGEQAVQFNRKEHASGSTAWKAQCQHLARAARRLPPVYPTARASAAATPKNERVANVRDLRRGMVAYFAPNHVVTVAGWAGPKDDLDNLKVWSNDVVAGKPGAVGRVPITWFKTHWDLTFLFGATWMNGYNFADLDAGTVPPPQGLGADFDAAVAALGKAIRQHRAAGHTRLVAALAKDLAELKQTRHQFGR